jgi:hypothetical protein
MGVDSDSVAALSSVVSLLVVSITAIAAVRQLRHNRNANEMALFLRLMDQMASPEMLDARERLPVLAKMLADDPVYLERLADRSFNPEEFQNVGIALRFLEQISVLVTQGGIAEDLVLAEYADIFVSVWETARPAIVRRRLAFGPHTGRAFEHMAMRAKRYIDSGEMERVYAKLERDERPLHMPA